MGRAVHRADALRGQDVVEIAEDALLDLPRVARASDRDDAAAEVQDDGRLGLDAVARGIARALRRGQHREAGLEAGALVYRGPQKELPGDEGMPCVLLDDAHAEAIRRA